MPIFRPHAYWFPKIFYSKTTQTKSSLETLPYLKHVASQIYKYCAHFSLLISQQIVFFCTYDYLSTCPSKIRHNKTLGNISSFDYQDDLQPKLCSALCIKHEAIKKKRRYVTTVTQISSHTQTNTTIIIIIKPLSQELGRKVQTHTHTHIHFNENSSQSTHQQQATSSRQTSHGTWNNCLILELPYFHEKLLFYVTIMHHWFWFVFLSTNYAIYNDNDDINY